jgi:hypothetical protein
MRGSDHPQCCFLLWYSKWDEVNSGLCHTCHDKYDLSSGLCEVKEVSHQLSLRLWLGDKMAAVYVCIFETNCLRLIWCRYIKMFVLVCLSLSLSLSLYIYIYIDTVARFHHVVNKGHLDQCGVQWELGSVSINTLRRYIAKFWAAMQASKVL